MTPKQNFRFKVATEKLRQMNEALDAGVKAMRAAAKAIAQLRKNAAKIAKLLEKTRP